MGGRIWEHDFFLRSRGDKDIHGAGNTDTGMWGGSWEDIIRVTKFKVLVRYWSLCGQLAIEIQPSSFGHYWHFGVVKGTRYLSGKFSPYKSITPFCYSDISWDLPVSQDLNKVPSPSLYTLCTYRTFPEISYILVGWALAASRLHTLFYGLIVPVAFPLITLYNLSHATRVLLSFHIGLEILLRTQGDRGGFITKTLHII